ncbi:MAG: sulfurtransferase [Hydrogenimonas sp.]|nr:sulfurtransferase [Hydrogenimonas sp.]
MKKYILIILTAVAVYAMPPLVDAQWLKSHIDDKDLVIVDVSSKKLYEKGHIQGSVNSPIQMWRKKAGDHLVVKDSAAIEKEMRRLGISKDSKVVLYSHHDNGKDTLKPAYVLWAMEYHGFKNSAILDGGIVGWKESGGKIIKDSAKPKSGNFVAKRDESLVADLNEVKSSIGVSVLIDARPPIYYFGAEKQKVLARAGHIPTAKSYFWRFSFKGDYIKNRSVLKQMLEDGLELDPKKPIITYCTGGLETSMNFFILHRLLGFEKVRLYDASMKEWANREDTPMRKYRWE